jgi:type IV fimbrial biogenesis protein FimT
MTAPQRASRGFTLIELLVTITIASILMMVAVPSLVTFKRNSDLTSAANSLLAAINAARSEAMKRGMNAMVVPTANGTNWSTGWVVFVDTDRSLAYTSADDATVLTQDAMPSYITVTGTGSTTVGASTPFLLFDASGFNKDKGGNFVASVLSIARNDVSGSTLNQETRLVIISRSGRARVCRPSDDPTNCTTSAIQ